MLERRLGLIALACTVICLLSSCANFTSSGRQQLAYARYVRKQSHNRVKMQTKFKKVKVPKATEATAAEPKTSETVQGPQSVSSHEAPLAPPPKDSPEPQDQ